MSDWLNELETAAQEYLDEGLALAVVPQVGTAYYTRDGQEAQATGKGPIAGGWQHGMSDFAKVKDELTRWGEDAGGVGVVAGIQPGGMHLVAVDHDGEAWQQGYQALHVAFPELDNTRIVKTGSGKRHDWANCPDLPADFTNRTFKRDGMTIELRANRSFCMAPPSKHPSGGRYEWQQWRDMDELAEIPFAELVDWLSEWAGEDNQEAAPYALPDSLPQGVRDEELFRLGCAMRAKGCTEDEVFGALKTAYDSRADKTRDMDDAYWRAKAAHICKTYPAGEVRPSYPELPEYAQLTPEQQAEAANAGKWLDAYVGFAGEASPMTPEAFHVAAGLAIGATAIARRVHLRVSVMENSIYPNLYCLYIGPSTVQRKSTAMRAARGLFRKAGLTHLLLAERQTPQAMALDMSTRVPHYYDEWSDKIKAEWLRERAFAAQRGWLLEEASHLLDSFNRDFSAGLLPMVLDLYDCRSDAQTGNTISRGREAIEDAYLTIFGVTTYGSMAAHMEHSQHWVNGLFARFAIVGSDDVGVWRFWPPPKQYPDWLIERLQYVAETLLPVPAVHMDERKVKDSEDKIIHTVHEVVVDSPLCSSQAVLVRDGAAWQAWERYARAVTFDMLQGPFVSGHLQASYGRLGTMLVKVALILATFDADKLPVTVEARHVYRAQQIVEDWRANLHGIFGKLKLTGEDGDQEQVLNTLAKNGKEWMSKRDAYRALHWKASRFTAAVDALRDEGEVERQGKDGSEEYRLAE